MKTLTSILALCLGWLCLAPSALGQTEKLQVVTTLPDLAGIVREVGGDRVEVQAICKGTENVHAVRLKPSHVVATSRADMFCQVGLSLEHAWVPGLLQTARNEKIQPGQPGFVTVSRGFQPIDVPESLSRRHAVDIHPEGNPHMHLSHIAGRHMAEHIYQALVRLSPGDQAMFQARYEAFVQRCKQAEARWSQLAKKLKGRQCLQYHSEYDYLLRDLGITRLGTLEPKPGVPPTPKHLQSLVELVRGLDESVTVVPILAANWTNQRTIDRLVDTAPRCTKCLLPAMTQKGETWLDMMEAAHRKIAKAYQVPYPVDAEEGTAEANPSKVKKEVVGTR